MQQKNKVIPNAFLHGKYTTWNVYVSWLANCLETVPKDNFSKVRPPMKDLQRNGGNQEETHKALFLLQVTTYRSQ